MKVTVYGPDQQAVGAFDGGKITEQKPIGFPGEGSAVKRLGPLFYWAWIHTPVEGYIPPHPHQGFEIITYVLRGKAVHGDSLGTDSIVEDGGLQLMQTGSGVYHEERMVGPDMEGFQIWFEPHLAEAFQKSPSYHQYHHAQFPQAEQDGAQIKTIIGHDSPVKIDADIKMWDIHLEAGTELTQTIPKGYFLSVLAVRGNGVCETTECKEKDFLVIENTEDQNTMVKLQASENRSLHMIAIQSPINVDYPLYPAR